MNIVIKDSYKFGQALSWAVFLEIFLAVALIVYYWVYPPHKIAPVEHSVTLTLQQVETPAPPKPEPPKPIHKVHLPQPIHKVIQLPVPPVPVKNVADAFSQHIEPPAPPVNKNDNAAEKNRKLAEYVEKLRQAVQAALIYPDAAKQMGITGRVRVEFALNSNDRAIGTKVITSSGVGMFDRSAIKAVNEAIYPAPPKEIVASNEIYQIWVEFKN